MKFFPLDQLPGETVGRGAVRAEDQALGEEYKKKRKGLPRKIRRRRRRQDRTADASLARRHRSSGPRGRRLVIEF